MALLTLFLFGALHGLQPDHAAAAAGLAARSGASVFRAALGIAAGHAGALLLVALLVQLLPGGWVARIDSVGGVVSSSALLLVGLAVVFQAVRRRYVVHAHDHRHGNKDHAHLHAHPARAVERHEHGHLRGALVLGLVLGVSGARTITALAPSIAGGASAAIAIGIYALGIALGSAVVSLGLDGVRKLALGRGWLPSVDLIAGGAACVVGVVGLVGR